MLQKRFLPEIIPYTSLPRLSSQIFSSLYAFVSFPVLHFMYIITQHLDILCSMIALPLSFRDNKSCRISATPALSSPLNGSSKISTSGFSMIACAIPSLCRIPSEYFETGFFILGFKPTRCNVSIISFFPILPFRSAKIFRFLYPLNAGRNPGVSIITPSLSGKSHSFPTRLPPT